jgi:hypothetical protein
MVVISHDFEYGLFGVHIFASWGSLFTPSIQLTHMLQDGLMKLCDDQSIFFTHFLKFPMQCILISDNFG